MPPILCKDCKAEGITKPRPIAIVAGKPAPGQRCATHYRAEKKRRRAARADQRVEKIYGLTADQYRQLLAAQGGRCYCCRRATGATRRLSVDHDHVTGAVRGLLCRPCNDVLGHCRDDVTMLRRFIDYLSYSVSAVEPRTFAAIALGETIIVADESLIKAKQVTA